MVRHLQIYVYINIPSYTWLDIHRYIHKYAFTDICIYKYTFIDGSTFTDICIHKYISIDGSTFSRFMIKQIFYISPSWLGWHDTAPWGVHENIIIIGDLLETNRRPIGDPSETDMPLRRPTCLIPTCLIGYRHALSEIHRRPTCLIGDRNVVSETDMPHRRPIRNKLPSEKKL